jgi:hypothetical protein
LLSPCWASIPVLFYGDEFAANSVRDLSSNRLSDFVVDKIIRHDLVDGDASPIHTN